MHKHVEAPKVEVPKTPDIETPNMSRRSGGGRGVSLSTLLGVTVWIILPAGSGRKSIL